MMGLLRPLRFGFLCGVISLSLFLAMVPEGLGDVFVKLTEIPPAVSGNTTAAFAFKAYVDASGNNPCSYDSFSCKLDDGIAASCEKRRASYFGLGEGNHTFEVCTNGSQGVDCASYNWTIDTTPPTVYVTASESFTSALNVSVVVTFSEPVPGGGGFRCPSVDACDLLVYGPGQVIPSSLKVLEPNLKYSLLVNISSGVQYGRLILVAGKNFCSDSAGNLLTTMTQNSSFFVHFDRRSVTVDVRTGIPEQLLPLDGEDRTVQATNNPDKLKVCLYFSKPVLNSSMEILQSLKPSQGVLHPANSSTLGNRRFCYTVSNLSSTAVVTINLEAENLTSQSGTPASNIKPLTFISDTQRPEVRLSTTSTFRTTNPNIPISVHFVKPMAGGFNSSHVVVQGGDLQSFQKINLSRYTIEIKAASDVISVSIPENVMKDVSGNQNLPSNVLQVKHYSVPIISRIVSTFVTVSVLATASASGLLNVATAVLQSAGASAGPISQPSSNLCRMVSHVQVFAMTRWLGVVLPVEYFELSRSLEWTIPYMTLPWEAKNPQPATVHSSSSKLHTPIADSWINEAIFHLGARPRPGSPLSPGEYELLFEVPNNTKQEEYTRDQRFRSGWIDFERSMFWLAVIGGSLIILHLLLLLILKLKKGTPNNNININKNNNNSSNNSNNSYGALTFPRFELFLLVLAQPCISQASAALVRGRTSSGVTLGIVLLVFVAVCLLAWLVFISGGIIFRKLLKYEEAPREGQRSQWYGGLTRATLGPGRRGQWTWKSNSNSAYMIMAGPLFEDLRCPPKDTPSQIPDEGRQKGDQVIASEEGNEDAEPTFTEKLFGTLGIYYPLLECAKRVCMGVMAGASMGKKPRKTPSVTLLCITLFQLIFIVLTKPFINKNVQLVEIISAAAEVGMLATCVFLPKKESPKEDESGVGIVMVVLFLLGFIPQMLNQWLAQRSQVRRFSPQDKSFFSGLKVASNGLLAGFQPTTMVGMVLEGEEKTGGGDAVGRVLEGEEKAEARGEEAKGGLKGGDETKEEEKSGRGEEIKVEERIGGGVEANGGESSQVEAQRGRARGGRKRGNGQRRVGQEMMLGGRGGQGTETRLSGEDVTQNRLKEGEKDGEVGEVEAGGEEFDEVPERVEEAEEGENLGGGDKLIGEEDLGGINEVEGGPEEEDGVNIGEKVEGGGEETDMVFGGVEESEEGKKLGGGDEAETVLGAVDEAIGGEELRGSDEVVRGHNKMMLKEGGEVGGGYEVGKTHGEGEENAGRVLGERDNSGGGQSIQVRGQWLQAVGGWMSGKEHMTGGKKMSSKAKRVAESGGGENVELGLGGGEEAKIVLEGVKEAKGVYKVEGGDEAERVLHGVIEDEGGKELQGGYDADGRQEVGRIHKGGEELGGGDEARRMIIGEDEAGRMFKIGESSQVGARWLQGRGREEMRGGNERRLEGRERWESRGREIAGMELARGKDAIWMLDRGDENRGGEGTDMWLKWGEEMQVLQGRVFEGEKETIMTLEGGEENKIELQGREDVKGGESTRVRQGKGGHMRANEERKRGNEMSMNVGGKEKIGRGRGRGKEVGRVPVRGGNEKGPEVGGGEDTGRGPEGGAKAERGSVGEDKVGVVGEGDVGVEDETGVREVVGEGDESGMVLGGEKVGVGEGVKEGENTDVLLGGDEAGEGEEVRMALGGDEVGEGEDVGGFGGGDEEKDMMPKEYRV